MKRFACVTLICFCFVSNICAQNHKTTGILSAIRYADSIILVSYKAPVSIKFINQDSADELIVKGKLNSKKEIIERVKLNAPQIKSLQKILTKPFSDTLIDVAGCFLPRHSILFYAHDQLGYINVCFQCKEIETSNEIKIQNNDFDLVTWHRIELFIRQLGIKYGFNNED